MSAGKFKSISHYKFNSIFVRVFLITMTLCMVLMSIFYYCVTTILRNNYREEIQKNNEEILIQADNTFISLLKSHALTMQSTLFRSNITPSIITPYDMDYSMNSALVNELCYILDHNIMIQHAFLYESLIDTVYSSDQQVLSLAGSNLKDIINQIIINPNENLYLVDDNTFAIRDYIETDLRVIDDRIFLTQSFPAKSNKPFVLLGFELNKQELFHAICGDASNLQDALCILNPSNHVILCADTQNWTSDEFDFITQVQQSGYLEKTDESGQAANIFIYKSPFSEWTYVYEVPIFERSPINIQALGYFIPFMLVFLIVGISFSFGIAHRIHRPVRALVESITQANQTDLTVARDEFDYLGKAFNDAIFQQETLSDMVSQVTPAILDRFFLSLLQENASYEYLTCTLNAIESKFQINDYYAVFCVSVLEESIADQPNYESDLYLISAMNIIRNTLQSQKTVLFHVVSPGENNIAVILEFPDTAAIADIELHANQIENAIRKGSENMPYVLLIKRGAVYKEIRLVKDSYKEAREGISRLQYYGEHVQDFGETTQDPIEGGHIDLKKEVSTRIKHIGSTNVQRIQTYIHTVIQSIVESNAAKEDIRRNCKSIIDLFVESMVYYRLEYEPGLYEINEQFAKLETLIEISNYTFAFCKNAIALIDEHKKTNAYRYIERTKEFVADNYDDSALTLNTVSDYAGISAPYLSKLFREVTNENFLDYLNSYRVKQAQLLLTNTDSPVKDIGFKVGFSTVTTFFRVFKKKTGITPGQFRDQK